MGVEYYAVCKQCNEYIDLHKAYAFSAVIGKDRPPLGVDCAETGYNDVMLRGGYWESRGLWFLWKHREHKDVSLWNDCNDEWWSLEPKLREVFSSREDEIIRNREKKKSLERL